MLRNRVLQLLPFTYHLGLRPSECLLIQKRNDLKEELAGLNVFDLTWIGKNFPQYDEQISSIVDNNFNTDNLSLEDILIWNKILQALLEAEEQYLLPT